ncbi:MAG: TolC family protein [Acidobacteria bacterium]|nr:TolC family protein [Acidobacteriota bacterium]MBI3425115.1 TolC family protein [Acidobacteriota bacterium]
MMNLKRGAVVLLGLAVLLTTSTAQTLLTLADCLRLAEAAPNDVRVAEQERRIADRELTQARAGFLPQAQAQTNFIYNNPSARDPNSPSFVPLNGIREYVLLGQVTQEFDLSGRLRAESQRARAAQGVAGAEYEIARRDLRRAVTTAYYRVLLTRHLAEVQRAAVQESRAFEERTRLLFNSGEVAQADVIKASALAASLEQARSAAELEASLANQELAAFWTKDVAEELALADTLNTPPPAPEVGPEATTPNQGGAPYLQRAEFKLYDWQRRSFEAEAKRARSALLPDFNFVFQYGLDSTVVRASERGYAAYFNLRIPIFDWFRARSQVEQSKLRGAQVETRRAIAERTYSRDYQLALTRVKRFFEQLKLTQEQIRLAEEDLRLSRVRYEGGEGQALDVVTAQSQLAQARAAYFTLLANYLNAKADLEVASGQ